MKRHYRILCFIALLLSITSLKAQVVTVSEEFNIRNDYAYDIIGDVGDKVLLYRDKGNEKVIEILEKDMTYLFDRNLELERKSDVYAVVPQDTVFTIIYGYREKKKYYLKAKRYDQNVVLKDTVTYLDGVENFRIERFNYEVSEDRSKTLLFASRKSDLFYTYVIDNTGMKILWFKESTILGLNVRKDFRKIIVNNLGEVNALFETNNNKYDKEKHELILLGLDQQEGFYESKFTFDNKVTVDLEMDYDNRNRRIILAGLLSDESEFDATGYFYLSEPIDLLGNKNIIEDQDFDVKFLEELYGKKLSKKKRLNDFVTREIVLRGDGGFLLFTEMHKEYYRRSAFNGASRVGNTFGGGRGWVDIYDEDVIVFNVHPNGEEHWKKILYKKQFSQDDNGVFSSFFIFKTPSRLRLIYNDEIKRNNTVSEYVLSPMGDFERNSLLSTDYQNLKLRFRDAVQVSNNVLIVPSERNYKLSLVRIAY